MKRLMAILVVLFLGNSTTLLAQDYFSDRNDLGAPISFKGGKKTNTIFSANINATDATSFKANFYQSYDLNHSQYTQNAGNSVRHQDLLGWGVFSKAKTENNLATLIKGGDFKPGFGAGSYIAYTHHSWDPSRKGGDFQSFALILSSSVDFSQQMFFNPALPYASQLTEKTFNASQIGLAAVKRFHPGSSNVIVGLSLTMGRKNNYDDLDTYEIKPDSLIAGPNVIRHVSKINPKGNTYASGAYKEFTNYKFKFSFSVIPGVFENKVGFIVYPSVDFSNPYDAKFNTGLAINFLKDREPSVTNAALFFEFNDLNNVANSQKSFLKRSLKIGISTSLSVITGK